MKENTMNSGIHNALFHNVLRVGQNVEASLSWTFLINYEKPDMSKTFTIPENNFVTVQYAHKSDNCDVLWKPKLTFT